jgi:short-subunit dehydrogenase
MKIKGKTAVVIGASGGIGSRISLELADKGANLVLVARTKKALKELKKKVQEESDVEVEIMTVDLTRPKSIDKLAKKIRKRHKKIAILFHAAGIGVYKKLEEISIKEWQLSMDVNVNCVFYVTQKLLPLLEKSKKAYVIALGSGMGKIALSGRSPYCSSKFALRGLILSLAKEYKKTDIGFTHLTMGSVLTGFGPLSVKEKKTKKKKGKKYLDPEWLAHYVVAKIRHDTLEPEVPIYPKHYYKESKKDKR